jgi:hypothetical protein
MKKLTEAECAHITLLLEELDSLIDCDDGTCFPWQVCEMVEVAKEIMGLQGGTEDEDTLY